MAKKKHNFNVPDELSKFIEVKTNEYIYQNEQLFKVLSDRILPIVFPDQRRPAVSTEEDFQSLSEKINEKFPEVSSNSKFNKPRAGKRRNSSFEITPSYLRNICYPENIKKQVGISKYRILKIYYYFKSLEEKRELGGDNEHNYRETLRMGGYIELNRNFFTSLINRIDHFNPSKFYISKQDEVCQWLGIINDLDIQRVNYYDFKQQVIDNFNDSNSPKVIGRVIGPGGSGKSTVLRRLAFDLMEQSIKVIWVQNLELFSLSNFDLVWNNNRNTLVIVEDYVRFEKNEIVNQSFLNRVENSENIKVIIGDRKIRGQRKSYDNLAGTNGILELDSKNNEEIVYKIISKNRIWENTAREILTSSNASQTSLYLLLFLIDRIHSQNSHFENNEGIKSQFLKIVSNDLNEIEHNFPGIGSALHYFSFLYKTYRLQFNLNALFCVAMEFNPVARNLSNYYKPPVYKDSLLWKLLSNYIYEIYYSESTIINSSRYLFFNHELLPDEGLSEVLPNTCLPFEEKTKFILLDILIQNKEISIASIFYFTLFNSKENGFYNNELREQYFNKLLESGFYHYAYLSCGLKADLLKFENEEIIYRICESGISNPGIWTLICKWIHHNFNRENKLRIYLEIINRGSNNAEVWRFFILNSRYDNIKDMLYSRLEGDSLILLRKYEFIQLLLESIKDSVFVEQYSKKLLDNYQLPSNTVCVCLGLINDQKYKIKFAIKYLKNASDTPLEPTILVHCLDILSTNELGLEKAKELFCEDNIRIDVKCKCLELLRDTSFGIEKAMEILRNNWEPHEWYLIWRAAYILKDNSEALKLMKSFVSKVFENYKLKKTPQAQYQYIQLFKIPLHNISEWKIEAELIISNWKSINRRLVTSILISSSMFPESTNSLSREILESWESELTYQKVKFNSIKNWLHISYALGHPNIEIRKIAYNTAMEIVNLGSVLTNGLIPDKLFIIAKKIVEDEKFPEWNFNLSD